MLTKIQLPIEDNTIAWLGGFVEMFWKEHEKNLKVETINVLNKYQSIFEGWKVPGKIHDYTNVQNKAFIMSGLLIMCISRLNDTNERKMIFDIIKDRLFLQIHNSTNIYLDYYSVPACCARSVAKSISLDVLNDYDEMLIERHHNLQCIASIMNYSFDIVIQPPSKTLCLQRWLKEQNIWERRLRTTRQLRELDMLQKVMRLICN